MSKFIYGVGKFVIYDFNDPTKVMGFANLQKFTHENSYSTEPVNAGNKPYPIASFKKEPSTKITFENAEFCEELSMYLDGTEKNVGVVVLTNVKELTIPADGKVVLDVAPTAVHINGFTKTTGDTAPTKGQFKVGAADKSITFSADDAGKDVVVVYEYNSGAEAVEYSVNERSLSKPFIGVYTEDIVDEGGNVVCKHVIRYYKLQCTSGTKFDCSHQTPLVQSFEAELRDPKRADGKAYSEFYEWVE